MMQKNIQYHSVYKYSSDTSREDIKYKNKRNKRFGKLSQQKRKLHILRLWRSAYNKTIGVLLIVDEF